MRYGVISDIHGNAEALRAVLADIKTESVDIIICLGDIVGYYPDPEECVRLIRENAAYAVAGNHDFAAIGQIDTINFTYYAYEAMEWTKMNLSEESALYLKSLPLMIELDSMVFVHSSPAFPERFTYVFPNSVETIRQAFESMVNKIYFVGHTHWPCIIIQDQPGVIRNADTDSVRIEDGCYYLVNPGSVGQPRNRKSASSYALYDTETKIMTLKKVDYNLALTQQRTIEAGLPSFLAERLENGK